MRTLALRDELAERVRELEAAAAEVKALQGLLPSCAYCKSIRSDDESWQPIERYIAARSDRSSPTVSARIAARGWSPR